jgi:hypothetical protein
VRLFVFVVSLRTKSQREAFDEESLRLAAKTFNEIVTDGA